MTWTIAPVNDVFRISLNPTMAVLINLSQKVRIELPTKPNRTDTKVHALPVLGLR
jgi:hypothetical protein